MVVGNALRLVLIGIGIGLLGAIGLGRLIAALLYDIQPTDPCVLGAIAALLIIVSILACIVPSGRAMRISPVVALTSD